jgi:hypothetical protein
VAGGGSRSAGNSGVYGRCWVQDFFYPSRYCMCTFYLCIPMYTWGAGKSCASSKSCCVPQHKLCVPQHKLCVPQHKQLLAVSLHTDNTMNTLFAPPGVRRHALPAQTLKTDSQTPYPCWCGQARSSCRPRTMSILPIDRGVPMPTRFCMSVYTRTRTLVYPSNPRVCVCVYARARACVCVSYITCIYICICVYIRR